MEKILEYVLTLFLDENPDLFLDVVLIHLMAGN